MLEDIFRSRNSEMFQFDCSTKNTRDFIWLDSSKLPNRQTLGPTPSLKIILFSGNTRAISLSFVVELNFSCRVTFAIASVLVKRVLSELEMSCSPTTSRSVCMLLPLKQWAAVRATELESEMLERNYIIVLRNCGPLILNAAPPIIPSFPSTRPAIDGSSFTIASSPPTIFPAFRLQQTQLSAITGTSQRKRLPNGNEPSWSS